MKNWLLALFDRSLAPPTPRRDMRKRVESAGRSGNSEARSRKQSGPGLRHKAVDYSGGKEAR
jgi:hypothetical protein